MQKYAVNQHLIETLLSWVKSEEIAIPEIQRPFVWDATKVRDLMDSLYQGYPVGYIIAWRNPNVKLKDGQLSEGKKILIDGQQRVTALTAALLGQYVLSKTYRRIKIKIAFHPIEKRFEVQNSAIIKDRSWIADISEISNGSALKMTREYLKLNPEADEDYIEQSITDLVNIPKKQIGVIELAPELDIETVTEIFIRINSKGVVLSQADFAMSKIAADTENGGNELRKAIDYFCRLATTPEFYRSILENDPVFTETSYFQKIRWLKDENEDLYDPDYNDVLRVAFTSKFERGRLSDLVSLLSGRNFETRSYELDVAQEAFAKLKRGVIELMNETHFKRFLMIIKSSGFVASKMIRSQNAINFAYVIYLKLKENHTDPVRIEHFVRRWFVYSILTGRYSGSPESHFDHDIKQIASRDFAEVLTEREEAELSDAFWNASLPQSLTTSVFSSPYFHLFLAAQVKANNKGFLSRDILVSDLILLRGDVHHLFPKDYLKSYGMDRDRYNQIANYAYMQSEINIKIGNKAPGVYFDAIQRAFIGSVPAITALRSRGELEDNLRANCVPIEMLEMTADNYDQFLILRRQLMAEKIRDYYRSL